MTMSRNYWSPIIREALHNGQVTIDQDDLVRSYREWRDQDVILQFENDNGDCIEAISPKRGNWVYSYKKRKRFKYLQSGMDGLVWDYALPKARSQTMRKTHLLFITLTYSRDYSIQEAWRLISTKGQALNRFSSRLYKVLGNKAKFTVKEAQSSGYPAPHILCIIDKPIMTFRHNGKWRVQNREIVEQIKQAWPYGYVDIQACVDGKIEGRGVMSYIMKYQTKTVDAKMSPKQLRIAELTHAWNKIYGLRDVISKQFMERLNLYSVNQTATSSGWQLIEIEYRPDVVQLYSDTRSGPALIHVGG
jgi:hypothetical protein